MSDDRSIGEQTSTNQPFIIEVADRVRRLPPYLFAQINKLLYDKRRAGDDVIDLGMGNPSDPPQDLVVEKLTEAARDPKNHGYSEAKGILSLRREVASKYFKQHGVQTRPAKSSPGVPWIERGIQSHVPGVGGAGRHGNRSRSSLSCPSLRGGNGRR